MILPEPKERRAREALAALGLDDHVTGLELLTGGVVNTVWMVHRANADDLVLKTTDDTPEDLYEVEAEGLDALRDHGLRTPRVLGVGGGGLALEALTPRVPAEPEFWEHAGRAVAALHGVHGDRFGWPHDGWLGVLPQRNHWHDDGHVFFAEQRLLRYVGEPKAEAVLTSRDRAALERLCVRLPDIVPTAPPVLTHGDLWHNNVVAAPDGEPVFIDPAVSWMWAEVDLSMMFCADKSPARFFDAYREVRPLDSRWRERMPVLFLREVLSTLAHEGSRWSLDYLRTVLRPFMTS
ncbi:fructosamine kinase family protein [Saccharothrix coeruleofusca]|uniref:Fructosamine kinase n=1 Tax=Saccharothrix coeruleofusca TaxID=33919 RepID=A0A918ATP9_9PSEU|nr:fructosamine kinase family protein [Saccharothrix coeruleofusca]MBP2336834.1 fructosamine-3-kinase [Saccharothrix coeruleofusca]GGP82899.1 fructosamine kinase [Saccharothrix coeruleofusca]